MSSRNRVRKYDSGHVFHRRIRLGAAVMLLIIILQLVLLVLLQQQQLLDKLQLRIWVLDE
jgi:hypothetical protein